jgi:hypothetical protein
MGLAGRARTRVSLPHLWQRSLEALQHRGRLVLANCPKCEAKNLKIVLTPVAVKEARKPLRDA